MPSAQPPTSSLFACLYLPPPAERSRLAAIAKDFSSRYEQHDNPGDLVSIDASGLDRLIGPPRVIGQELARDAAARGLRPHVGLALTQTTAMVMAIARPGLTIVDAGEEATALAPIAIGILEYFADHDNARRDRRERRELLINSASSACSACDVVLALKRWGLKTLAELAALPADDLVARLGRPARIWQAIARGEDIRPLVPALPEERFDASLELEWPIEGLEPLSFVLTRLLEPLSTRLERRDRGAAVLHVELRLVTRDLHARRLQLPSPIRDVRTLRTLALLDLESHPPDAAIDRVTVVIDPTPGRVLQHTLFTRPHPTPDQLSTLLARLGALMGQDRIGAAATVDSYRPGAFEMTTFQTEHISHDDSRRDRRERREALIDSAGSAISALRRPLRASRAESRDACDVVSALRRCRQPVPARVIVERDRPVRVTADRRGFAGGAVTRCVGPWRTSGNWWERLRPCELRGQAGQAGWAGEAGRDNSDQPIPPVQPIPPFLPSWTRDEWDVAFSDGAVYRIFRDRETDGWFIDGIVD